MFNEGIKRVFRTILAFATIVAFVGIFGLGVFQTWVAPSGQPPPYSQAFLYVATLLAALVGGTVLVGLGESPKPQPPIQMGKPNLRQRLATLLHGLFGFLRGYENWQLILQVVFAGAYVLMGLLAVGTWMFRTEETADLLKNLATSFMGLAVSIVPGLFRGD